MDTRLKVESSGLINGEMGKNLKTEVRLREWQRLSGSNPKLQLHEVQPRHHLRYGVLHLPT